MNNISSRQHIENQIIFYRELGIKHWLIVYQLMNNFTKFRTFQTLDEIWFVEHYPVFTLGQVEKKSNSFLKGIPVVNTNRGGKITYHGPGQQIIYFLINLKRRKMSIHEFIGIIKNTAISCLKELGLKPYYKKKCQEYI